MCTDGKDYFRRKQKRYPGNNFERTLLKLQADILEQGIVLQNWGLHEAEPAPQAPKVAG